MKSKVNQYQGSWIQIAVAGLSLACATNVYAGAGGSGGGTAVRDARTGRLVLLDFETDVPGFAAESMDPIYAPDRIEATPVAMTLGYDRTQAKKLPAYGTAIARLNAWKASSPVVVGLIRSALDGMDWVFTPYHQEVCAPETIPGRFGRDSLYSAVVYTEGFGARMSLPIVNQLGHSSMTGLLVHEALRHVAIAYQEQMSDDTLRRVTARIIFSNPQAGETLDHPEWFGRTVSALVSSGQSRHELFDSACAALQRNGKPNAQICSGAEAIAGKWVLEQNPTSEQRTAFLGRLNSLDDGLVDVILAANPSDDAAKTEVQTVLTLRERFTWAANEVIAGAFSAITADLVDATHQLNQVFTGMSEDGLRKYLGGDHSDVGLFDRIKMNSLISKAQDANKKALQAGTVLSCPHG